MAKSTKTKPNNVVEQEAFDMRRKLSKLTSLQLRRLRTKTTTPEQEPWLKRHDLVLKAVAGGLLAGLVYNYFPVG